MTEATKRGFDVGCPNRGEVIAEYVAKNLTNVPADVITEIRSHAQ